MLKTKWNGCIQILSQLFEYTFFQPFLTHAGHEIVPNTGANATKFFTLATKSWKLVAKLATRMFHHNLT